jgi:exopolyphosphatase/guanosine-5'-triphosphate,3'-diphosphate pyrophosphatase
MLKLPDFFQHRSEPDLVAVVDLGSNSFHLLVAKVVDGQIIVVDRLREMVRLGAGLDANKILSKESQQRALSCLAKFGQRLRDLPVHGVRIVGTNTLRNAVNATEFLNAAEALLGHPVDIISGREEARLIYLGVANSMPNFQGKRLVIDIYHW